MKTGAILLPSTYQDYYQDWLTKVKTSKIVTFCYFWPKIGKKFILIFFKYIFSSWFSLQFSLRCFYKHYFVLVNGYLMQNIKNLIEIPVFLCFFTTLYQIWPKFYPANYTHFTFFGLFLMKSVRDSININNLCCNPVVLKKIVFCAQFAQKRDHYGPRPKWKTIFFWINN